MTQPYHGCPRSGRIGVWPHTYSSTWMTCGPPLRVRRNSDRWDEKRVVHIIAWIFRMHQEKGMFKEARAMGWIDGVYGRFGCGDALVCVSEEVGQNPTATPGTEGHEGGFHLDES
jgi:hypothetical protein